VSNLYIYTQIGMNNTTVVSNFNYEMEPFIIVCNVIIGFILLCGCLILTGCVFVNMRIIGRICYGCANCHCCDEPYDDKIQIVVLPNNKVMNSV